MKVVMTIAWRNILRHRTKTLIVGLLILIGITVLIVGNSLMDTAARGIGQTYVESYTGHLVITGRHRGTLSIMGLEGADSLDEVIPTIPAFGQVLEHVSEQPFVQAVNPQATTMMLVDYGDKRSFTQAFGIDPTYYQEMFPENIEIIDGRMLAPGEDGIVLSAEIAAQLERGGDVKVMPGDTLLLTGMSQTAGIRVREVPIRGIFRFRHSNPVLDFVSLMDITNVRALAGMNVASVSAAELTELEAALLGDIDEDALFGGALDALFDDAGDMLPEHSTELLDAADALFGEYDDTSFGSSGDALFESSGDSLFGNSNDMLFGNALVEESTMVSGELDEDALLASFHQSGAADVSPTYQSDAWHFLLVKLQDGVNPISAMVELQRLFDDHDIDVMVSDWLSGAGSVALLATGTKTVFNVVVLVIAVVAVIIIMNTLVISVTERTMEIGTMRALGAQKAFVRRVIVWETVMTSGVFGVLGIIVGLAVLFVLNATGIEAPNVFFEILFGGKVLHPVASVGSIVMSLAVIIVIGVVASLYPVSIALKTEPVKAMQE